MKDFNTIENIFEEGLKPFGFSRTNEEPQPTQSTLSTPMQQNTSPYIMSKEMYKEKKKKLRRKIEDELRLEYEEKLRKVIEMLEIEYEKILDDEMQKHKKKYKKKHKKSNNSNDLGSKLLGIAVEKGAFRLIDSIFKNK